MVTVCSGEFEVWYLYVEAADSLCAVYSERQKPKPMLILRAFTVIYLLCDFMPGGIHDIVLYLHSLLTAMMT